MSYFQSSQCAHAQLPLLMQKFAMLEGLPVQSVQPQAGLSFQQQAKVLGLEVQPIACQGDELADLLGAMAPLVLGLQDDEHYLLITRVGKRFVEVLNQQGEPVR